MVYEVTNDIEMAILLLTIVNFLRLMHLRTKYKGQDFTLPRNSETTNLKYLFL